MSLTATITSAQARGAAIRPKVAGFPYLAESLRLAGVVRIEVTVPSWTTVLTTTDGSAVQQGTPMIDGTVDVPPFDREAFITALRSEQAGEITYPEWMKATWQAGVAWYAVDLGARTCTYRSPAGDTYVEDYPAVDLADAA
jgi:uncharacterized protein YbcV (DUF1398 family)